MDGLVELMGHPAWATGRTLLDPLERSRRGASINQHIRAWAREQAVADLVRRAQMLGVPLARYNTPADVLADPHERARGLFQTVEIPGVGPRPMLVAPFHFDGMPLRLSGGPPALGEGPLAVCTAEAPAIAGASE